MIKADTSADFPQDGFAIIDDKAPEVELCYPAYGCSEKCVSSVVARTVS